MDIPQPPRDAARFNDLYLVFEYVESDLSKILASNQPLMLNQLQYIMMQLLAGLRHMHSAHVLHRDLKPQNILVNRLCDVRICDLGLARSIAEVGTTTDETGGAASPGLPASPQPTSSGSNTSVALTRQLTRHVVTRWYRAPELILLKSDYTSAIDVWSVGCIFAELLHMHIKKKEEATGFVLFPGKSCFPMSPGPEPEDEDCDDRPFDQLNVIFQVIGIPGPHEITKVLGAGKKARKFIARLEEQSTTPGNDLKEQFPDASDGSIGILKGMLCFDPVSRITIDQAMEHAFFCEDGARDSNLYTSIDCSTTVQPLNFEFELLANPSSAEIKKLMYVEIDRFHAKKSSPKRMAPAIACETTKRQKHDE